MKVEIKDIFGDDLMVVNAARVSFNKQKSVLDDRDIRLIHYLATSDPQHTAPFRHPMIQFRIECPIFVERQLFKHQVGLTANSVSGRYVDFSSSCWMPDRLRYQSTDNKQGSAGPVPDNINQYFIDKISNLTHDAQSLYNEMESSGIAKELCRVVMPMTLETTFIWTGSLLAYIHLWKLRTKPDVQKETRDVALEMLRLVKEHPEKPFEHSLSAFSL